MKKILIFIPLLWISFFAKAQESFEEGKLYVKYREENTQLLKKKGINKVTSLSLFKNEGLKRTYKISIDETVDLDEYIRQLEADPMVEYVEKVPVYQIISKKEGYPNDPFYDSVNGVNVKWHLDMIEAEAAWEIQQGKPHIKVAVVDNAVWGEHEDLQIKPENLYNISSKTIGNASPPDSIKQDQNCFTTNNCEVYDWSHGTHCAGLVGAINNNNVGIASIGGGVTLMGVSCPGPRPMTLSGTLEGVIWAAENGAKVMNLSWGGTIVSKTLQEVIKTCLENGIVIVAGAGNNNSTTKFYPAAYPGVISVGSVDSDSSLSNFSNYGSWVNITAPGGSKKGSSKINTMLSTIYGKSQQYRMSGYSDISNTYYDGMVGTSMASPFVAGLCGLMLSHDSTITSQELKELLILSSTPLSVNNNKAIFEGSGVINAKRLFDLYRQIYPIPKPKNLSAEILSDNYLSLSWETPDSDTLTLSHYKLYRDDVLIKDSLNELTYLDPIQIQESFHVYAVAAGYSNGTTSLKTTVVAGVPLEYSVVLLTNNSEGGSVEGGGSFPFNSKTTIRAHANPGYHFEGWRVSGDIISTDSVYTFTVDKAYRITALFNDGTAVAGSQKNQADYIYPNPVNDNIYVASNEKIDLVQIYDLFGRLLFQNEQLLPNNGIDVRFLKSGAYILVAQKAGLPKSYRFIKL